jgi:protein involved in polysaccharide export with SLBB domain
MRKTFSYAGIVVLAAFAFTALPALAQLHPGDTVSILVYNHPDLSTRATVDASGNISLPLAGTVDARSADTAQLAQRVRASLSRYLPLVAVQVQIVSRNQSVFISGGPGGVLPYTPGERLGGALAQLNAPQGNAPNTATTTPATFATRDLFHGRVDLRRVTIERDDSTIGPINATAFGTDGTAGPALLPGDTIRLVDKPIRVDVQGDVREPGMAYLTADEPLSDAILQVGGYIPTSAQSNIVLDRDGKQSLISAGGPQFTQPAHNGDGITVPRALKIGVVGSVAKPGDIMLTGDTTLVSALYNAGGPTKWADLSKITVLRGGAPTTYDITALTHGAMQNNPVLHDGDTVYVPEGHKVDYGLFWQALGTVAHWFWWF